MALLGGFRTLIQMKSNLHDVFWLWHMREAAYVCAGTSDLRREGTLAAACDEAGSLFAL